MDFCLLQKMSIFIVTKQQKTQPYASTQSYKLPFRNQRIL